jgi:hypothetical protein
MSVQENQCDEVAAGMIASLDSFIGECEARGWLKAAAIGEELVCEIHQRLGIVMPTDRIEKIEALLDQSLTRKQST